ncbi:MAG: Calx-beta domain-containing protein, partial [Bacteroidota bacterium]
ETVVVTLSSPINASLGTNDVHTYTIIDNDATTATIAFDATTSNGDESVPTANLTLSLSEVSGKNVSVDYAVTGTATGNGTDYTLTDGTLTISAGNLTSNISIASIIDDVLDETDETIIVTLSSPVSATLGVNTTHTYTIKDNDVVTIAFNSSSSEGEESIGMVTIPVSLSGLSVRDVSVDYMVSGTATGSGTDYTLADGTLTIPAGNTTANITIASIVDDLFEEVNETIVLTLSAPLNASLGTNAVHTYNLLDDDGATIVNFTIDEVADIHWNENSTYTSTAPSLSGDIPIGTLTFAVAGNDSTAFTINPTTGVVSLSGRDYENPEDADLDNRYEVTVRATDDEGNFATESWVITIVDVGEFQVIPTAFTPNGDQENDVWELPGLSENATVVIFNRNGTILFQSIGYAMPWDGTYQNQPLPSGTYYYSIKSETDQYKGSITILR